MIPRNPFPAKHRPAWTPRREFLKTIGTAALAMPFIASELRANPPSSRVRHAAFGTSAQAWADLLQISSAPNLEVVALCDVDEGRAGQARKKFPKARFYTDWRKLLEAEAGNIDSVNVATPDHMHAPIGVSAMLLGKHIFGEKPLAHNLHETRRMTEIAREKGLVTQMGIQSHSGAYYRTGVRAIRDGLIGKVKEVHSWCFKTWGDNSLLPTHTDPVPKGFDWDLWLGVREARPFIGKGYYHPGNWRKRLDFGVGTLGDMACHILDPVFSALDISVPLSVRSEGPAPNATNWALDAKVILTFAGSARTNGPLKLTWYDGAQRLPAEVAALLEGRRIPQGGSIFIGTDGVLFLEHSSVPARLFPSAKFKGVKLPLEKSMNHYHHFIEAVRGGPKPEANFDFAGPLTEAVLLGGVASRFPNTDLKWDAAALRFEHAPANQFVRQEYRKGWEVPGL
ncbi:MAG: Gfo/Idh/MocA family oxidoreductase [Puniceicoccales bacterium]|jgi:predicted dehydrogenase|nr:Gfo/Idh/MocA family oxidoreductase [Puniceicoccales bacterium]